MKIKARVLRCDTDQTVNGTIYPREVIEEAVAKYQEAIEKNRAFGQLHPSYDSFDLDLQNLSHVVRSLSLDGNDVVAEIETLKTEKGDKLNYMLSIDKMATLEDKKPATKFGCAGKAQIKDDKISSYEIVSVDALRSDDFSHDSILEI